MTEMGFQYTISRYALDAAGINLIDEAREFAKAKMAEMAHAGGYKLVGEVHEKQMHAKVVISVDEETGEEMGDLVYLPKSDDEWTMLVIRWRQQVVHELREVKIDSLSLDLEPNAFGQGIESVEEVDDRVCRVCGCTTERACVDNGVPCHWAADDLCSTCEAKALRS